MGKITSMRDTVSQVSGISCSISGLSQVSHIVSQVSAKYLIVSQVSAKYMNSVMSLYLNGRSPTGKSSTTYTFWCKVRFFYPTIKGKVINLMSYMSVHICNTHVLISDDNIKYIKHYLE